MKIALITSLKYWVFSTLLLGGLYPFTVTIIGKFFYSEKTNGSIVRDENGVIRGSSLIAQKFQDPKYFWPRPSAVDYNAAASGATNLSLTRKELKGAAFSYASGLDPDISPENAFIQIQRISKTRNMDEGLVKSIVEKNIHDRDWHVYGEKTINVMALNLELDRGQK